MENLAWLGRYPARARVALGRLANCGAGIQTDLSEVAHGGRRRVIGWEIDRASHQHNFTLVQNTYHNERRNTINTIISAIGSRWPRRTRC